MTKSFHEILLGVLYPSFLWWLQTKELPEDKDSILYFLVNHKVNIGLLSLFLVLCYLIYKGLREKKVNDTIIDKILDLILKLDYKEKDIHYRVTIFKKISGLKLFFILCYKYAINWKAHCKKQTQKLHKYPNFFKKYLYITHRQGQPHPNGTSTYFEVPNQESDIDGFVSYIYFEGTAASANLPNIKNVDLTQVTEAMLKKSRTTNQIRNIKDYIKKGKLRNLDKLKIIHRRATNLWATILSDNKGKAYGVLILDDDAENKTEFKKDKLDTYAKILEIINNNT